MSDDDDSSQDEMDEKTSKSIAYTDKYSTPEEIKKQKQRDKKKNKRKKKRQIGAISRVNEQKEGEGEGEGEEEIKKEHPLTVFETLKALQEEQQEIINIGGEEARPKKRVYGVQIDISTIPKVNNSGFDPVMDKFARSTEGEQNAQELVLTEVKKQHRGLRCARCFSLLCRDEDFEYLNGQLNVTGESIRSTWDGLIMKGGMVYCQKMHLVGYKKHVTFTNQSKTAVVLKVEKTTFIENYVNNPAFSETDKVRNKLQFQERGHEGMWRQLSLPPEQYRVKEFAPADRYHGSDSSVS